MNLILATLSASHVRSNFYTILNEVVNKLKCFTVTKRGEPQVVIMHPDEVASWEETVDILADKKLVTQIFKSEADKSFEKVSPRISFIQKRMGIDKLAAFFQT